MNACGGSSTIIQIVVVASNNIMTMLMKNMTEHEGDWDAQIGCNG